MDNTKKLGLLGELKAQYDFIRAGYNVSIPLGDYCPYDLLIQKDDVILRVQVKTCEKITNGKIEFKIKSHNYYVDKVYTTKDADYFYLYCLENEQSYLYPIEGSNNRSISIRIDIPNNNQTKGINFAKDFEFKSKIKNISGES